MPPILKMMDDINAEWKAKGCHMLGLLLEVLQLPVNTSSSQKATVSTKSSASFLQRTGYHNIFAEALLPMFTYIPSITPEDESVTLFKEVFRAVIALALLLPTETTRGDNRELFLDKVLREGVLSPLAHFPTPSSYPKLATLIMSHVSVILGHMGIDTVKHLPDITPLLSAILQEPFALSHIPLLLSTLTALQSVMLNAWPRVPDHQGAVMMGLCLLWKQCLEEEKKSGGEGVGDVKTQVKETVAMLDAVMQAVEDSDVVDMWSKEKQDLIGTSAGFEELFGDCVEKVRSEEANYS